jgi:hypothetical protein
MEKQLTGLLKQVKAASDALKSRITELDAQIAAAHQRRGMLTESPVTKADYLAYVEADIRRQGDEFAGKMARFMRDKTTRFGPLEHQFNSGLWMGIPYLTADRALPTVMTEEAACLYFGDMMVKGFAKVLDGMDWQDTMPADARRVEIDRLDMEISTFQQERDDLAKELIRAGLAG